MNTYLVRLVGLLVLAALLPSSPAFARAKSRARKAVPARTSEVTVPEVTEPNDPTLEQLSEPSVSETRRTLNDEAVNQYLGTGNADDDIKHYQSLTRHLGIDLGMLVPFGDYQSEFGTSPMIGMHLNWEAIAPFNFAVSFLRSSAGQKTLTSLAKLSVTSINVGTVATFPMDRVAPFVRVEGAFQFNDVTFNDGRTILSGNDIILTTVGVNLGIGIDFVVGREISIGLDMTYHYAIPKKLSLSNGNSFDLGSSFATAGFRVNF